MNDRLASQLKEFANYLENEYVKYINYERSFGRGIPTEAEFAIRRLGVPAPTYSRWKKATMPVSEANLLTVSLNMGTIEPLRIFGKENLIANDPDALKIFTQYRRADPETRTAVKRLLSNHMTDEELRTSPA